MLHRNKTNYELEITALEHNLELNEKCLKEVADAGDVLLEDIDSMKRQFENFTKCNINWMKFKANFNFISRKKLILKQKMFYFNILSFRRCGCGFLRLFGFILLSSFFSLPSFLSIRTQFFPDHNTPPPSLQTFFVYFLGE